MQTCIFRPHSGNTDPFVLYFCHCWGFHSKILYISGFYAGYDVPTDTAAVMHTQPTVRWY